MKNQIYLSASLALVLAAGNVFANEDHHKDGVATGTVDSVEAVAAYPMTTCVVSGEKLEVGEMGPPFNYVYKEEGKPDRLVRFCCKHCIKDFNKDPAKYLNMIDDAAAAKAGDKISSGDHDGHAGHNH